MKLQFCSLEQNPARDKMIEWGIAIITEELSLDVEDRELFRVYVVDDLTSRRDSEPLAGVVSGSIETGFNIRLKSRRSPRATFLSLAHELKHVDQAMNRRYRKFSNEFHERDSEIYAREWDSRLPASATSYHQIIDYLKKVDQDMWQEAMRSARKKLAAQKQKPRWAAAVPAGFNAREAVLRASQAFGPRGRFVGIEYR